MEAGIAKTALILLSKPIKKKILENLKDGDVASQRIRDVLMDSNFKIEAKQDGQNEADLKKAKHLFEEGVQLIHEDGGDEKRILDGLLEKHRLSNKSHRVLRNSSKTGSKTGVSATDGVRMSGIIKAKESWRSSKKKALKAFHNHGLKLFRRILAARLGIMATILEDVQNPLDQLRSSMIFLRELNSDRQVITNVEVQMTKDSALDKLRQIAYEKERKALIRSVADVNRMVWNYAHNECGKDDLEWPSLKLTKGEVHPVLHGGIRQIFVENHEGANHDSKCTADTFVESHLQRYTCATDGPIFESSSRQRSDDKPRQASVFILDENGKETKTFGRDVFTNESILTSMAVNDKSQLLIVDDHTHRLHAFNMQGDHIGLRASWEPHNGYSYIAAATDNRLFKTHDNRSVRIYDLNQTSGIYVEHEVSGKKKKDRHHELNGIAYDSSRQNLYVLVKITSKKGKVHKSKLQIYKVMTEDDVIKDQINLESVVELPPAYSDSKGIAITPTGLVAIGDSKNTEHMVV